ncbi:hypothetical protein FQA39_LY18672 [Lamprigera yunnana]|nr:hypothetical protein FQA39_LY18672 [Lamprigera yunnana]
MEVHIVRRSHPEGGDQQTGNDGRLARHAQARAAAHQPVGQKARAQHADKGREKGQRGQKAGFDVVQPTVLHQIVGEPGQEEPQRGAQTELPQIDQAAALLDQLDLGGIGCLELARLAIDQPPDGTPHDAQGTGDDEDHVQAVLVLQPAEHRGEKGQAHELTRGVESNRRGPFALGEPGGDHAVVDGVGRCLEPAHQQAQRHQHGKAGAKAHQQGGGGPEDQRQRIQQARRHAIDQPAAGDLHGRISPAEGRQNQSFLHGGELKLLLQRGQRDREIAAVQVVDDHGDEQHSPDEVAAAGGLLQAGRNRFVRGSH